MKTLLALLALTGAGVGGYVLLKRSGHLPAALSGSRRRRRGRARGFRGPTEVNELQLFCENDGDLYRQQVKPIEANLDKKVKKGVFDKTKAVKLWGYLADNCARKYVKEFGESGQPWHKMFSTADRREVAKAFNDSYMQERGLR